MVNESVEKLSRDPIQGHHSLPRLLARGGPELRWMLLCPMLSLVIETFEVLIDVGPGLAHPFHNGFRPPPKGGWVEDIKEQVSIEQFPVDQDTGQLEKAAD